MRIDNMIQSLRVLTRADAMIAEATFKARLSQIALHAAAFFICIFGLVMAGIAVFLWLRGLWGPISAAAAVATGSFLFSALLLVAASYRKPAKELQIARDMHKMALDSLTEEAKLAGNDLTGIGRLFRSPLDSTLLALVGPLAGLLLRFLRRSPEQKSQT